MSLAHHTDQKPNAPRASASQRTDGVLAATPAVAHAEEPSGGDTITERPSLNQQQWRKLRRWMVSKMTAGLDGEFDAGRTSENLQLLSERFSVLYELAAVPLSTAEQGQLFQEVTDEIVGYGPIERLLRDNSISEVMVNRADQVYIERGGKLTLTDVQFDGDEHIRWVIDRIVRPLGRRVDRKEPMVDARLPDGSRVNAIIPPAAIDGPTVTIRKFSAEKLTMKDLVAFGTLNADIALFLKACVVAKLNIVISGGTGCGKTTLLNILSGFIPEGERIVTIEDSAELQLQQPHVVRLEAQPPDLDGEGEVRIRGLVRNALRMRPDRIVVGEVRGGEALDMLQAMNTGHEGSMTTVHSNSPRDTVARLETMAMMSGLEIPLSVIRRQIASAIDLIVHQSRFRDGSRRIVRVTEVQGMEGEVIVMQDIFAFQENGVGQEEKCLGEIRPTGVRPRFDRRLELAGFELPAKMFMSGMQLNAWPKSEKRG